MKMTFRWFGQDSDSITLEQIRQVPGVTGIMGLLDHYAAGEAGQRNEIRRYVDVVHSYGLEVEVIESVNVHESIKLGLPDRDHYLANYKQTIENLAACGGETELTGLTPHEIVEHTASQSGGFSLPGWEPERLAELDRIIELYEDIDEDRLRANYKYFLDGIIPTCEQLGVCMAVHPDDPGWPVFGIRASLTPRNNSTRFSRSMTVPPTLSVCVLVH